MRVSGKSKQVHVGCEGVQFLQNPKILLFN
jgi:hypothetical protein